MTIASRPEEPIDKIGRYLLLALAVGLPLIVNPFGLDLFTLPKLFFLELIVISLLFVFGLRSISSHRARYAGSLLDRPLLFFLLISLMSTVFSIAPHRSFYGVYQYKEGLLVIVCYVLVYFFTLNFIKNRTQAGQLVLGLTAAALLVSLYGLIQHYRGFSGWDYADTRVFSTISNPVYLGAYLALLFPLVLSLLFGVVRGIDLSRYRPVTYLVVGLVAGCLLLTFTRAAWLGTLAGVGVMLLALRKTKQQRPIWTRFFFVVAAVVVLFVFSNPSPGRFLERLESIFKAGRQTETRLFLWKTSLQAVAERPVTGYGLQTFGLVYPLNRSEDWTKHDIEKTTTEKVHNDLLQVVVSSGLFGLLAYLWFFITLISISLKRMCSGQSDVLQAGLIAATIAYLVNLQFNFTMVEVTPVFWLILGLAVQVSHNSKTPVLVSYARKRPLFLSGGSGRTGVWLLGLFCLMLVYQAAKPLMADIWADQALKAEMKGAYGQADARLRQAVTSSNGEVFYYQLLGSLLEQEYFIGNDVNTFERSAQAYKEALTIDPRNSLIALNLGDLYVKGSSQLGNAPLSLAVESYAQGLKNDRFNPVLWARLGIAYAYQDSPDQALKCMKRSIELDPGTADFWFNLGLLYEMRGEPGKAKVSYTKALELDPRSRQTKEALDRLKVK